MNIQRVVITGMGSVSPCGIGNEILWDSLKSGKNSIDTIKLFDPKDIPVTIAAEVKDESFMGMLPPRRLRAVHRVVPMALKATEEALNMARILDDNKYSEETEVIVGTGAHGIAYSESQINTFKEKGYKGISPHLATATFVGMISSEISMHFGFHGLSQVVSTGCTSAHDSLGYAFQRIKYGQANVIISGGAESSISPVIVSAFAKMGALAKNWNHSPGEGSRPFDSKRSGFVMGEGAWIFVLESYEHAKKRGATILAEITGFGSTSDAYHKTIPQPSAKDLVRSMNMAIKESKISPADIDYINPHGTGTLLNDFAETLAIKKCLGQKAYSTPISSFKSTQGHPQGASGACGLAGSLLALKYQFAPPTMNLTSPDPDCDLDYVPMLGREVKISNIILNSIAFGSRNSSIVIKKI